MYSCSVLLCFFNIEKQKATSKLITHLKLADNSVTEDEQVIRQMTIDYYRNLFTAETVQLYIIILICFNGFDIN